ncbi:MAG: hypothetical protein HYX50_05475, partial [Chloroflexi bacterium]|nr:hypothetical protein [Chloroflexota bacterium]
MRLLPHLSKISFRLALLGAMAVGIVLALEFGTTTSQRASANPTYGTVTPNPASTFIIQGYKFSLPVRMTTGTIGPYPASCPSGPYTADNFCRLGAYGIVLNYDGSKVTLDTSTGTSTGSNTTTTLKDTTKTWKINEWANSRVFITGGAGATQDRLVVSNTANTLTVTPAWDAFPAVPPDNTSVYTVGGMTNGGFLGSTGRPVICPVGGQTAVGWAELHCITTGDYTIRGANGTGILTNLTLATN